VRRRRLSGEERAEDDDKGARWSLNVERKIKTYLATFDLAGLICFKVWLGGGRGALLLVKKFWDD
jgi:hypothetical protein